MSVAQTELLRQQRSPVVPRGNRATHRLKGKEPSFQFYGCGLNGCPDFGWASSPARSPPLTSTPRRRWRPTSRLPRCRHRHRRQTPRPPDRRGGYRGQRPPFGRHLRGGGGDGGRRISRETKAGVGVSRQESSGATERVLQYFPRSGMAARRRRQARRKGSSGPNMLTRLSGSPTLEQAG